MKVLFVDDKRTWHTLFEKILSGRGIDVLHAYTLKEALNVINDEKPDIVILDATIRNANIYDVLPEILELGVPVLAIGYRAEGFDPQKVLSMGAVAALEKPFEAQVLIEELRRLKRELPALKKEIKPELMLTQPPGSGEVEEVIPIEGVSVSPSEEMEELHVEPVQEVNILEPVSPVEEPRIDVEPQEIHIEEMPSVERVTKEVVEETKKVVQPAVPSEPQNILKEEEVERILREIAWEVIPEIAEKVIREEIQEFIKSRLA